MRTAQFQFFGELNDLLPPARRFTPFEDQVDDHASLKHVIESLGVPHTEIGAILMDGQATALANRVQDRSHIDVYPYHFLENNPPSAGSIGPLQPLAPRGSAFYPRYPPG